MIESKKLLEVFLWSTRIKSAAENAKEMDIYMSDIYYRSFRRLRDKRVRNGSINGILMRELHDMME